MVSSKQLTRATVGLVALLMGTTTAAAAAPGVSVEAMVLLPLQICGMPIAGDLLAWGLPLLRQFMIVGGIAVSGYGLLFAPAGGKVAPKWLMIGGAIVFAAGVLWVSLIIYFGVEVLGGDQALINTATCGLTGSS